MPRHANARAQLVYLLGGELYGQANEKRRMGFALGAAALLHLAAVLIAGFSYQESNEELVGLRRIL